MNIIIYTCLNSSVLSNAIVSLNFTNKNQEEKFYFAYKCTV